MARNGLLLALFLFLAFGASARAQEKKAGQEPAQGQEKKEPASKPLPQLNPDARYDYQGEATFILQRLFAFPSPYQGENSFRSRNEAELSHSYEMFLGVRLTRSVEVYVNPEIAWGNSLSVGTGLAGYPNGDLLGQPNADTAPFLARAFVRWRIPMPHLGRHTGTGEETKAEQTGRAPNIIEGSIPTHRLVVQAGKFAISDVFDVNSYANNPRTQFLNKGLANNLAYDFAQDNRGSSWGISVAWVNPTLTLRLGTFALPTTAAGSSLTYSLARDHGDQAEVEVHPRLLSHPKPTASLRFLAYRNAGRMGRYQEALAVRQSGPPDVTATETGGAVKYGFGVNFEQALADGGDTGVFGRLGWNEGATESFAFAEADRSVSLGGQLSGAHWHRADDRVGVALVQSGLSRSHRDYLALGGQGLSLGDGRLRYGGEAVFDVYYSYHLNRLVSVSPDYQWITHPGYNRDRGPAALVSLRAHLIF